jgi:hypothetical protein
MLKYPLLHKYNIPVFEKHVVDAFLNEISIILVGMVHANGQKALFVKIPQFTTKRNFT